MTALDLARVRVETDVEAIYDGRCAADGRHEVHSGDRIYLVKTEAGDDVGWVCERCAGNVRG